MIGLPIGIITLDLRLRVVGVDELVLSMFDARAEDLTGKELDELISERDRRGAQQLAMRLNAYKGELIDLQLVLKVGPREHFVRLRMTRYADRFLAYVESSEDRASMAFQLALLQQRWQTVVSRSDDGIAMLDGTGKLIEHNDRFSELLQFRSSHGVMLSSEALNGRRLLDLLGKAHAALAEKLLGNEDEFRVHLELGGATLDVKGRTVTVPLRGRVEVFLLVRDITDEQQVRQRDSIIQADLAQAAGFQRSILSMLPQVPGIEIDVAYQPLEGVGGDLYDVTVLADGTVRMFMGDATGHGVKAALATLLIKAEYDALKDQGGTPATTLGWLNDRIVKNHKSLDVMFTGVIADIAPKRDEMRYANGAHPSVLLARGDGVIELDDGGPFVGAMRDVSFPQWTYPLRAGDAIVLVSDGIAEQRNTAGVLFGEERLQASIARACSRQRSVAADVLAEVHAHRALCPATDDITLLAATTSRAS